MTDPTTDRPPLALITGGGGFIGSRMAERLAQRGYRVRGLDVVDTAADRYAGWGGELIVGDLLDDDTLARAVDGVDLVIHTAARMGIEDEWDAYRLLNVQGPVRVAEAAKAGGASRFVHLSSVMVYGFHFPDDVTEDGPLDGADNPYCQTKIESEEAVMAFHEPGVFEVYLIRPGDVYGPGSMPWVKTPVDLMKGGMWLWFEEDPDRPTVHNHVYVDNLVDGIEVVLDAGRSAEPFNIVDGQRTTAREFFGFYEELLGLSLPEVTVAQASELGLPDAWVNYLTRNARYSIDKIRALGWEPKVSLADGMAATAEWMHETGMLDQPEE